MTTKTITAKTNPTRPLIDEARSQMPGFDHIEAAIPRLREAAAAAARERPQNDAEIIAATADSIAAGDFDVIHDFGDRIVSAGDQLRRWETRQTALDHILEDVQSRRNSTLVTHADAGLRHLAAVLDDLLTAAGPAFAALGDATTAEAAIDAGTAEHWATVRSLAARHQELRAAQATLVNDRLEPPYGEAGTRLGTTSRDNADLVNSYGYVRPDVANTYLHGLTVAARSSRAAVERARLEDEAGTSNEELGQLTGPIPWLDDDPIAVLRWLAQPDVQAWVPTVKELTDARDAAAEAQRQKNRANNRGLQRAQQYSQREYDRLVAQARNAAAAAPSVTGDWR